VKHTSQITSVGTTAQSLESPYIKISSAINPTKNNTTQIIP
jgi:hypothetical protein